MFCMYVRTFDVFKEDKGMSTKKKKHEKHGQIFDDVQCFGFKQGL